MFVPSLATSLPLLRLARLRVRPHAKPRSNWSSEPRIHSAFAGRNFCLRCSSVTSAWSGSGFTLEGACLAAKAKSGARKGRSKSSALHTNASLPVPEQASVPSFEPLRHASC